MITTSAGVTLGNGGNGIDLKGVAHPFIGRERDEGNTIAGNHAGIRVATSTRTEVSHNTLHVAVKEEESRVLSLVSELAARGRVLRIEINSASLEDIFIELTQRGVRS